MADNESINVDNTNTESLMLSAPQANSTPIVNNRMEENDIIKMMKLLFNEQSVNFDTKLDNFNEKLNQFDEQFNDIKKEIKNQSCHYDQKLREIKTRLDEKIESENKKFELNKDDKVSSSGNYDKINKNMVIGDNSVDVGSNNEILWGIEYNNNGMIVCFEGLKRERWCDSERYIEREKCCWERYYYERCFKSERYCERKGEVENFKICRNCLLYTSRTTSELNAYSK